MAMFQTSDLIATFNEINSTNLVAALHQLTTNASISLRDDNDISNLTESEIFDQLLREWVIPQRGVFFGPQLFGMMFDIFLFGVTIRQFITWCSYAEEDRWFIRGVVGWSMLWGTVGSVYNLASGFNSYVYNFGDYNTRVDPNWGSWATVVAVLGSVGAQAFYTHRAYKLSGGNNYLTGTIVALLILSFIGGIGSRIIFSLAQKAATPASQQQGIVFGYFEYAGAMAADLIITGSIIFYLIKSRTGWKATDQLVNKLLKICAETQLPPTLIATAMLIVTVYIDLLTPPTVPIERAAQSIYAITGCLLAILPKTYIIGLLSTLNSRISLRVVYTSNPDPSSGGKRGHTYPLQSFGIGSTGIQVVTETYTHADRTPEPASVVSPTSPRDKVTRFQDYGPFVSEEEGRQYPQPIIELDESERNGGKDNLGRGW